MDVLVSPISLSEAYEVADGGADIIDIKNINEGSLGASFPWIIREIVEALKDRDILFSATLGDLPAKPGTASLAALGAAVCGVKYVKAGLHGPRGYEEAAELMAAVATSCKNYDPDIVVVAAGYADYRRFGGIDPLTVVRAAHGTQADLVMLDTAFKDGQTLFDVLTIGELEEFISAARASGLRVALAGSIRFEHLDELKRLGPDIVGVRGCLCTSHDRSNTIKAPLVRKFVDAVAQ